MRKKEERGRKYELDERGTTSFDMQRGKGGKGGKRFFVGFSGIESSPGGSLEGAQGVARLVVARKVFELSQGQIGLLEPRYKKKPS